MTRRAATIVAGFLIATLPSSMALAGGWAVTSVDEMPVAFESGVTYEIRYTILQHGQHPVDVKATSLTFVQSDGGQPLTFEAEPMVAEGQYAVEVSLPEAGDWSWSVEQGWFGVQELGVVAVQSSSGAVTVMAGPDLVRPLLLATLAALGVLGAQLVAFRSRRGQTALADSVG